MGDRPQVVSLSSTRRCMGVLARYANLAALSSQELALIDCSIVERHGAGHEIFVEGELQDRPRFLLNGWIARTRYLPDGRRQIFGFYLPGEAVGFCQRSNAR